MEDIRSTFEENSYSADPASKFWPFGWFCPLLRRGNTVFRPSELEPGISKAERSRSAFDNKQMCQKSFI